MPYCIFTFQTAHQTAKSQPGTAAKVSHPSLHPSLHPSVSHSAVASGQAPVAGSATPFTAGFRGARHRPYSLSRPRAGPSSLCPRSPPDARGWRARGRCRSSSMSAPSCEDAEAPPGAPPGHRAMPGLICGRLHSASPTVVSGIAAPGRAFRFRALGLSFLLSFAGPLWVAVERQVLATSCGRYSAVSQLLAGGSYWPPGGAPAPPECLGGAFVSRPRAPHPAPSSDASR